MKKIIIYSTRICPYCIRAKNFFDKKNIEYTEIMIDKYIGIINNDMTLINMNDLKPAKTYRIYCYSNCL